MAVYKVIQDIEAEDKFVGPLTLKQFIFAGITVICIYLVFILIVKHLWYLALPLLPVIFTGIFLAFPWGRDQPTEIWLLAKVRFLLKPRRRVWDQSGVQELVTITAPKHDDMQYTNNLSQNEVQSRLRLLANTIDSRGWAIKNVNVNLANTPSSVIASQFSDRLVDPSSLPHEVSNTDVLASDDIMDPQNNPLAQHFDQLINNSSQNHRQAALQQMDQARTDPASVSVTSDEQSSVGAPAPNYWFINQPDPSQLPTGTMPLVTQLDNNDPSALPAVAASNDNLSPEEKALLDKLHKKETEPESPIYGHMRVIQPLSVQARQAKNKKSKQKAAEKPLAVAKTVVDTAPKPAAKPVTQGTDPAILELAINNDRDVASLAREANAIKKDSPNEVIIKLR